MSKEFLKNLYRGQDHFLHLIYEFNLLPSRYIHPSWLEELWGEEMEPALLDVLRSRGRGERRLSEIILTRLGMGRNFYFDFEDSSRRLALIDGATLEKLVFLVGLAVNYPSIARVVERKPLLALKSRLGERAYLFALKKAPFLLGRMEPSKGGLDDLGDGLSSLLVECGMRHLQLCFSGEADALTKRLLLKLPSHWSRLWEGETQVSDQSRFQTYLLFKKVLLKEVDPGWTPCFS